MLLCVFFSSAHYGTKSLWPPRDHLNSQGRTVISFHSGDVLFAVVCETASVTSGVYQNHSVTWHICLSLSLSRLLHHHILPLPLSPESPQVNEMIGSLALPMEPPSHFFRPENLSSLITPRPCADAATASSQYQDFIISFYF